MLNNFRCWRKEHIGEISLSLNTRVAWSLIGLLAAVDAIGLKAEGIWLAPHALMLKIVAIPVLLALSAFYTYFYRHARLAELMHVSAAFMASIAVLTVASYVAAGWQRPLVDADLVSADHALGLDWLVSYKWVVAHPLIYKTFYAAYCTPTLQLFLLVIGLTLSGRAGRSWEMLWLYGASCFGCVVFSGLWPAAGAFSYYHVEDDKIYLHVFNVLHNGTLKVIGNNPLRGVIQFPSFHVALAILLTYAVRGMRKVFPALLVLNVLMLLSTPSIGGHHFSDIWGGAALTVAAILTVRIFSSAPPASALPNTPHDPA